MRLAMVRETLVILLTFDVLTSPASARSIVVPPGPGTPIQDAINSASAGDTIRLRYGTYNESVTIDRAIKVRGRPALGLNSVRIDAGCNTAAALTIAADGVRVRDVEVVGGTRYTIDIEGRSRVVLRGVVTGEPAFFGCRASGYDVEYGINVFNSTNLRISRCLVLGDSGGWTGPWGYTDAGIYIGGIPANGNVRVSRNLVVGSNRGILVEDSADDVGGRVGVLVKRNLSTSCDTAIFLHNSDRIRLVSNVANDSRESPAPAFGIHVDVDSNDNLIARNKSTGNVADVQDDNGFNCWRKNEFTTGTLPLTSSCP